MRKSPLMHAGAAVVYITVLVTLIFNGAKLIEPIKGETILFPIAFLSLFVLSAAVMGYLFVYQPAILIFDGKRDEGITFFLQTVGIFAGITACLFLLGLLVSFTLLA